MVETEVSSAVSVKAESLGMEVVVTVVVVVMPVVVEAVVPEVTGGSSGCRRYRER